MVYMWVFEQYIPKDKLFITFWTYYKNSSCLILSCLVYAWYSAKYFIFTNSFDLHNNVMMWELISLSNRWLPNNYAAEMCWMHEVTCLRFLHPTITSSPTTQWLVEPRLKPAVYVTNLVACRMLLGILIKWMLNLMA